MINLIAIIGQAGSGKDSIYRRIVHQYKYHPVVGYTTRPIREGEVDGRDYHFVSVEEFDELDLITEKSFNGWYYGISKESFSETEINIGVFNPSQIMDLLERNDIDMEIYEIIASDKARLIRQLTREENPDVKEILRRFGTDAHDFEYLDFERQIFPNESLGDLAANVDAIGMLNKFVFAWNQGKRG